MRMGAYGDVLFAVTAFSGLTPRRTTAPGPGVAAITSFCNRKGVHFKNSSKPREERLCQKIQCH